MISKSYIEEIIQTELSGQALFLVDIAVRPGNRIAVELDSDRKVSIDDCAKLSRLIESKLDRETEDFELEVSSAGMGRPLKLPRQYLKYIGREVSLRTHDGRELIGVLINAETWVDIQIPPSKRKSKPEENVRLEWTEIKECKVNFKF